MDHIAPLIGEHFEVIDRSFRQYCMFNTHLERKWTGGRWLEGPAYFADGRYLVFSDIPNDRIMRFDEIDGSVKTFRTPCNNTNGHTRDRQGRLISCEHRGRRVSRTEHDGTVTVVADNWQGKRLNSPNDAVVTRDGAVWFTDPTYGIDGEYEGDKSESEVGASNVYRVDPRSGEVAAVADDFVKPNGLAFSADESTLYVADTGATHVEDGPRHIRRFAVADGRLSGGEVLSVCDDGLYDGFRIDIDGNIWTSARDGVHCLTAGGDLIGKIKVPETVANVCFGGPKRNYLYICGTTSLYACYVGTCGLSYF